MDVDEDDGCDVVCDVVHDVVCNVVRDVVWWHCVVMLYDDVVWWCCVMMLCLMVCDGLSGAEVSGKVKWMIFSC